MRSLFITAAFLTAVFASPYAHPESVADYIRAASNTPAEKASTGTQEPCAQISSALSITQNSTTPGQVDAKLALQCLQSVPLGAGASTQLLGLKSFLNFQSTLAYLKDPTPGYLYPAVDIMGGLDKISDSIQNNGYDNEYDFQSDLRHLIDGAYDEHFNYWPDITQVFAFVRKNNLYSVSTDGHSLPEVYMDLDLALLVHSNYSNYTASPVRTINGKPVETFLNSLAAELGGGQDPDANYNTLFPVIPSQANNYGNPALFVYSDTYQGTDTVVTFKNGTTKHVGTFALTSDDFKGVTDGSTFFKKFCSGKTPTSSAVPSASVGPSSVALSSSSALPVLSTQVSYAPVPSQTAVPAPMAFPDPWAISSDQVIACYFPEENKDLAVLSVVSFSPVINVEFEDVTRECLATANKLGKKKLMIDLRGNGGGNVPLAYDMFKQLFPSIQPWGTTNFRAWDLFNDLGKTVTQVWGSTTDAEAGRKGFSDNFGSIFNVDEELSKLDQDFDSWADFYGPVHVHDDYFTNLARYNLSDPYPTSDIPISGYANLTGITPKQTFASEDIVMLQDGACASTCAVFAEFMKSQGKVRSVVVGGRKQTGPMQGVGGVKGANVYTLDYLLTIVGEAVREAPKSLQTTLKAKYGKEVEAAQYATDRAWLGSEGHAARVNIRNNIRKGDTTLTPLQFVYEAADCRFFYTAPMLADQTLVWKAAYDANWANGQCVYGSTGQVSSKPGTGYILDAPDGKKSSSSGSSNSPSGTKGSPSPTSTQKGSGSTLQVGGLTIVSVACALAFVLL